jgi:hypothetical protein
MTMSSTVRTLRCALALLLWLHAAPAWAQVDRSTAEALMRQSGLWAQLGPGVAAQVTSGMFSGLEQAGERLSAGERARIATGVDAAFAPEPLRRAALELLAARVEQRHVAALRAWYDSVAGAAITRLEERTSAPDFDLDAALAEGRRLLASMVAARRERLQEIVGASKLVEAMSSLTINLMTAVAAGVAATAPGQPGPPLAALRAEAERQRPQLMAVFAPLSLALLAAVYRSLPDDELQRYGAFLASPAGRHFNELGQLAMETALVQAAHALGRTLPAARDAARS